MLSSDYEMALEKCDFINNEGTHSSQILYFHTVHGNTVFKMGFVVIPEENYSNYRASHMQQLYDSLLSEIKRNMLDEDTAGEL